MIGELRGQISTSNSKKPRTPLRMKGQRGDNFTRSQKLELLCKELDPREGFLEESGTTEGSTTWQVMCLLPKMLPPAEKRREMLQLLPSILQSPARASYWPTPPKRELTSTLKTQPVRVSHPPPSPRYKGEGEGTELRTNGQMSGTSQKGDIGCGFQSMNRSFQAERERVEKKAGSKAEDVAYLANSRIFFLAARRGI